MKRIARFCVVILNRVLICPILFVLHKTMGLHISFLKEYRIAHLAWNTYAYYYRCQTDPDSPEHKRHLIFGGVPCNDTLFEIWKRYIPLIDSRLASFWFNADMAYLYSTKYVRHLPYLHTEFKEINLAPALSFSDDEEQKGRRLLEEMGIGENDWFMCFQSRDETYRKDILNDPELKGHKIADIETYLKAAEWITELGGYAIRMGFGVSKAINTNGNSRIIDYATDCRTDFGDIYLTGKCRFFLSSPGLMAVSTLFKKPLIVANMLPPRVWPVGRRSLMLPKLLKDENTGEFVPLSKLEEFGMLSYSRFTFRHWDNPSTFAENGLIPYDNEPEDLLAACQDMMNMIEGSSPDPEAREIQEFYKRTYCMSVPGAIEHGPDVSPSFVLKHKDVFLN